MGHRIAASFALAAVAVTLTVATAPTPVSAQTETRTATVGLLWVKSRDERAAVARGARPEFPMKMFGDFDVAGDGRVSVDEWMTVVAEVEGPEAFARALFEEADRDGDGILSPDEFAGMTNADLAAASAAMEPTQRPADVIVPVLLRASI